MRLFLLFTALSLSSFGWSEDDENTLIILSLDGFRYDYPNQSVDGGFSKIAKEGSVTLSNQNVKVNFNTNAGTIESYIFKGNLSQLKSILNNEQEKDILNLNKELHLKSVLSISDFKNIISENSHTRHFNEIISHNDKFIKKSFEIEKLESEFLFLKNIPERLCNPA